MKIIPVLLVCFAVSQTVAIHSIHHSWNKFKNLHKREFINSKEENFRRSLFYKNIRKIKEHNERYRQGLETYRLGINQFTDYTNEELDFFTRGLQIPEKQPEALVMISANSSLPVRRSLPDSFDWRNQGLVTPIRRQEDCGSCWAFVTAEAIEYHYKIQYGFNVTLSVQQLVDCVPEADGCSGGWMADAYMYIVRNGGINFDKDYPYQAEDKNCRYSFEKPKVSIRGYASLSEPNEEMIRNIVVIKGPVSVAIDASDNFVGYSGGVYYNPSCSTNNFNHAVVIVGYGIERGQDYWLAKNSWGANWGLSGYVKMARNKNNHCGIASYPSFPVF